MNIKILDLNKVGYLFAVTIDRGNGKEVYTVKNKQDLCDQLLAARALDTDYGALKALVGTDIVIP